MAVASQPAVFAQSQIYVPPPVAYIPPRMIYVPSAVLHRPWPIRAHIHYGKHRLYRALIMVKNGMRPIHPGEVLLEDYIKPMGVSVRAVSIALHVPYSRLREIVDGKRGVSADTALRLERYFSSEARGWLALQAAYDLRVAEKQNAKLITREIEPLSLALSYAM